MANLLYKCIIEKRDHIKKYVNLQTLLDELYGKQALDRNEYEIITNKSTSSDKVDYFLDNLHKEDDNYKKCNDFVDVLKKHYNWLYKDIIQQLSDDKWKEDTYKLALYYGDFPRKPPHYIERTDKIVQVESLLKGLQLGQKVVLHGMTGCGKSSLAAGTLNQNLVLETFNAKVFWINIGHVESDQIVRLMQRLYNKLKKESDSPNNMVLPNLVQDMRQKLKSIVLKDCEYKQMLLVLDNVCEHEVVDAFDIGCKMLITTQDKSIIGEDSDTFYVEVNGTFKKLESLTLFAKCLEKSIDFVKAIPQATKIHELCKGHPMHIALFGSQMVTYKSELVDKKNTKRWEHFIRILQMKENLEQTHLNTISSCIDTLDKDLRDKYEDFCIFVEDVNITSQVLQTLWGLDSIKVSEIMTQLENKSLTVSYYSNYHNTYIYGIHVVLLRYLKQSKLIDQSARHRKLIKAYESLCNSDYSKLPQDNYIFQYIGYHLQGAGYSDKFNIYYNLKFIEAKIKATGIGDLLKDYKIYEKEIIGNYIDINKNKLKQLISFVESFGRDLHKYDGMNIIQCGLKQPKDRYIYAEATDIAKQQIQSLYFKIQSSLPDSNSSTESLPKYTTYACFGRSENEFLIGTEHGNIELWEHTYMRALVKFDKHQSKITYLEVNQDRKKFLSICEHGIVRLWLLDDTRLRNGFGGGSNQASPHLKQSGYKNLFGTDIKVDEEFTYLLPENDKFTCASFSNYCNDTNVVTGSKNGLVTIWKERKHVKNFDIGVPVDNVKYSYDDNLIIASSGRELFLYDWKVDQKLSKSTISSVDDILIVDDDSFVTVHDNYVSLWKHDEKKMPGEPIPDVKEQLICDSSSFTCGVVFENELFVSSKDQTTFVFDLNTLNIIKSYKDKKSFVKSIDVLLKETSELVILCRLENNTAILRGFQQQPKDRSTNNFLPVMSCYWPVNSIQNSPTKPRLAIMNTDNRLQILNGFNILNETSKINGEVITMCFCPCGNKIVYGLHNGCVIEYEIKTKSLKEVMRLKSSITYLNCFNNKDLNASVEFKGECQVLIVAAGHNGILMLNKNGKTTCMISPTDFSRISIKPIIQCYHLKSIGSLLTISHNRTIKLWNLKNSTMLVMKGEKMHHPDMIVTNTALSNDDRYLVITMSDRMFEIYELQLNDDGVLHLINFGGDIMSSPLRSCSFSHDAKYLGIGAEDGSITILELYPEKKSFTKYTTLLLHKSAVRHLLFSKSKDMILVSVGEQITWWNLNRLPESLIYRNRRSIRGRLRSSDGPTISTLASDLSLVDHKWNQKRGPPTSPHLLRTIKFHGSHSNYVWASPAFTTFTAIDDTGNLYIMEMFD